MSEGKAVPVGADVGSPVFFVLLPDLPEVLHDMMITTRNAMISQFITRFPDVLPFGTVFFMVAAGVPDHAETGFWTAAGFALSTGFLFGTVFATAGTWRYEGCVGAGLGDAAGFGPSTGFGGSGREGVHESLFPQNQHLTASSSSISAPQEGQNLRAFFSHPVSASVWA